MAAGSDAAKQVAHIVLLDSNFASMTNIVGEGRTIISNIEKGQFVVSDKDDLFRITLSDFYFLAKRISFYTDSAVLDQRCGDWCTELSSDSGTKIRTVFQKDFLRHVMRVALPAALTMVGTLVLTEVLSPFWNGEDLLSSLYHLVLGGMVSLIVVYRVCMPMTRYPKSVVCRSYRDLCGWACNCTWFPGNSPVGLLAECIPDSDDLYGMCPESGTDTYL